MDRFPKSYELLSMIFELTGLGCRKIVYVFLRKSIRIFFGQVSDELWGSKYEFWTHRVPKYKIHVCEEKVGRNFKITVLNSFPLTYELLRIIFELTGSQNTRAMFLRIFGGKNLKSSFEQVSDELRASQYDFLSHTVPK